ncbi:NDP-hexose 2,3-dehydratase family protein [Streptomyces flavofungini]|uniref:NDP-hexose 2,3-dehydratase family protein n=1 Tax=Streptomyces flavofungini TaxID=68200 RepID=A0ABS0XHV2_9ACTN|nr:NDP-hexose 2,3-dehydratase family protein [Streptomyces flavofungini]MBJ3812804.1 NDP-hexose 2,3-dehydratase family protein [Streptomyces flavofungini]GHC67056.1 NDP-hexose 2,3-dehydratase [Streptomyces flavofungini]
MDQEVAPESATAAPDAAFAAWWAERRSAARLSVTPVPFRELPHWSCTRDGDLVHDSGRFFTVSGMRVRGPGDPGDPGGPGTSGRDQPVIVQPEIGVLGLLLKHLDGEPHVLLQAKAEPGNIDGIQLSPTVQATRSNYTRVHRGGATRHLEHFTGPGRGRVLVDSLQSEQGAWFWRKHNRNMVVEPVGEVAEHPDFRWIALRTVRRLLGVDHLVNMDTRSVLGCLHPEPAPTTSTQPAAAADPPRLRALTSWLIDAKQHCPWYARPVPLGDVAGWTRTETEIADDAGRSFRIIAVRVEAGTREVRQWAQPLLAPRRPGLAVFLCRGTAGVRRVLVRARTEPGLADLVELGPTVQWSDDTGPALPEEAGPFDGVALTADPARVRFDAELSEEGGRFYRAATRYRIIEADDTLASSDSPPPADYRWLTVRQLQALAARGHHVNVQARSLLACLASLP